MDRGAPMDVDDDAAEPRTGEQPRRSSRSLVALSGSAAHTVGAAPNAATGTAALLPHRLAWEDMGLSSESDDGQEPVDNSIMEELERLHNALTRVRLAREEDAERSAAAL